MFGSGGGSGLHEYSPEEDDLGKVYDRVLMKRLLSYLKPHRLEVTFVALLIMGNMVSKLAGPWLMKIAIDQHIEPGLMEGLGTIAFYMIIALLAQFAFNYFQEYRMQMLGQNVMYDMRRGLF